MNFNDLKRDLQCYPADRIVFIGLGNHLRGDDAAGLYIIDKIAAHKSFKKAHFIKAYTTPESHLEKILRFDPEVAIFIDSANWGGAPGEMSWIESKIIDELALSTHTYSITFIEKYLKLNANLDVKYLVIQPLSMHYDFGIDLSRQIQNKIREFFN